MQKSGKSPLVHLFLMLLLFSCLYVPEGGSPVTPEVEWRERERTGEKRGGEGSGWNSGFSRCWAAAPS